MRSHTHYSVTLLLVMACLPFGCGESPSQEIDSSDSTLSVADMDDLDSDERAELEAFRRQAALARGDNPQPAEYQAQQQQPSPAPASNPARPTAPANAANAGKSLVFVEHKLHDPGMNNAHSHTLLIPEGWKVEGGLMRPAKEFYNMPVLFNMKVTAPDGRRAMILPSYNFEFFQGQAQPGQWLNSGNMYMPLPESAGKWLLEMAEKNPDPNVKDLKLVSEKMDENLTATLRQQAAPLYQHAAQMQQYTATTGVGSIYDTQAQIITFTYTENGQPFEESFLICWYANLTTIQGQISSGFWGTTLMISVRDKPGSDMGNNPIFQTIFQSLRATPAWQNEMNNYWAAIARIKAKGARDRNEQWQKHNAYMRKNNEDINNIIASGWKSSQASSDRMQTKTVDAINEVTPYQNTYGETVRLPSFYDHVYTDGNGRYLLNNDANYNPNLDPNINNQNWQSINKTQ